MLLIAALNPAAADEDGVSSAASEVSDAHGTRRYERVFFNRFNPQTALDMVERLPGFALDGGDDDLRGFGGAAGNVLIDGERPSIKSGGIEDALRRIPARRVKRIEVIRGTAGLSEAAGQSVVANVVRSNEEPAGSWKTVIEHADDGTVYPAGEISWARQVGAWDTSTKLNAFWERYPLQGSRIRRDADGELLFSQVEDRPSVFAQGYLSTNADRSLSGGVLTVTARAGRSHFLPDTERLGFLNRFPDGDPDERFSIDYDSILAEGEIGIDWTRPLSDGWSIKLLSFSSLFALDDEQNVSNERPVGISVSDSTFQLEEDGAEVVLRGTIGKGSGAKLRPEFGGEVAYNRLESALSLVTRDSGNVSVIGLPAANVLVEEVRGELFANLIWQTSESVSVETGIAVEASEISVSGDAENSQTFLFAKPFATLIYDARQGLQIRLGAKRSVGQLDFSQFAASAEADDDRLLGGNPDLGPDQTTRGSLTIDLRSETRGALNVELFHEWRKDVIEQIELPSGAFGAANAGQGRLWGVTANAALPLTALIPGGLIEIQANVLDSDFADPLSRRDRGLSDVRSPTILIEFRQDLIDTRVSWGGSYRADQDNEVFFADEESFSTEGSRWSVFVETTRFFGMRTNLALRNIGDRNFYRTRRFFEPSRSGTLAGTEKVDRSRGMFATLTFTGQF